MYRAMGTIEKNGAPLIGKLLISRLRSGWVRSVAGQWAIRWRSEGAREREALGTGEARHTYSRLLPVARGLRLAGWRVHGAEGAPCRK